MQCDIFISNMAFCIFQIQKTGIYAIIQRKTLINLHFSKKLFKYNYYKFRFSVYFYLRNTIFIKNQE